MTKKLNSRGAETGYSVDSFLFSLPVRVSMSGTFECWYLRVLAARDLSKLGILSYPTIDWIILRKKVLEFRAGDGKAVFDQCRG